jgi:signal transduction histidine kinase/AmiR/NasT family two-component response regulator
MKTPRPEGAARRRISFQSRITGAAMATAVAVLLAACVAFCFEQWRGERHDMIERQAALARLAANGQTVRQAYADPAAAAHLRPRLHGLLSEVDAAYLMDARGALFARIGAPDLPGPEAAARAGLVGVVAPVVLDGRRVGELHVYSAPKPIGALLPRYLALVGALLVAAVGLSLLLGRWFAGRLTEPVNRLSQAMREVADSGDFSQRVERTDDDELGRLNDAFNDLVAKLHVKDRDLRQTMVELVAARDAADAANSQKSQFLANMSHEIRTPLNGLLAMTQVMALDDLGPVQHDRLEVIRASGQALLAILNDVLDVSKIEAGKLELEIGDFDVEAVAGGVYAGFVAVAEKKGLALALEVADDARDLRAGDAQRLRQILSNLVANALKFTHRGEVRIRVRGEGRDGGEGLRLAVSDTGIGIAPEIRPLLFQKFSQADSSTTRKFGGTGLGLAICQELCALMGGRIWLESEAGAGSTFHVALPLARVKARAAAPTPAQAADADADEAPPAEAPLLKVLAAEDNPTNQLVLKTIMGIFGVDLTLVGNGREAVEAWGAGTFDLILMDIQMPEMDGLAATRAIRAAEAEAARPRIPIIALSAHAMTHQVREYLEAGIDLHVPKPIELPRLQAALETVMAQADAARGSSRDAA